MMLLGNHRNSMMLLARVETFGHLGQSEARVILGTRILFE